MCGEAPKFVARISCVLETPPRAWGRQAVETVQWESMGNTPTCVGKTRGIHHRGMEDWKHPHVCGEDVTLQLGAGAVWETPPRAWGRPSLSPTDMAALRNTPTCVGKTLSPDRAQAFREKHPHVRGEDMAQDEQERRDWETPPRAWGRRRIEKSPLAEKGNTPTCVGKTFHEVFDVFQTEKHPHVRGEDPYLDTAWRTIRETPPRAWGRPLRRKDGGVYEETPPRAWGRLYTLQEYN